MTSSSRTGGGRRVVVTGRGAVTPIGADWPTTWASMVKGSSGIRVLSTVDTTGLPVRIGGEVLDLDLSGLPPKAVRRTDSSVHIALSAALEAVADANLVVDEALAPRVAVVLGSAGGPTKLSAAATRALDERGARGLSPYYFPGSGVDSAAGEVALHLGAQGPSVCVVTACATGATSIGEAARLIRHGAADVVVAGGVDDTMTRLDITGAAISRALSTRNDDPEAASRPFDRGRDGFVMSAGGGVVVLESEEHARARGARVLGELAGYGATTDAFHPTAPHPEAGPARRAMHDALAQAGLAPQDVGYINAHGTSTPLNDTTELRAIRGVFGSHATRVPVSSTKSMTGHMLGGAGAVELIVALESVLTGVTPPTINCDDPEDPEVNFVPHTAQEHRVEAAMSNSFGFGGHNAVLIARRWAG
ncbi:beta-ketoacyl-ACP synthase II [Actinosynnema pretiosum subsp. pretiosum]|uniref:3-oxoacyl-[acyl-carrier-protein] synthase 2 n=1 Tax=Actinosynnema pretiosum subsp. pretiosum TaxID=103721 RepID=A0AA45L5I2_9PSEU|nr:3-oxoacyl-[acyl-carrier-protein] synthase, KASII [Actinosynnema pretiosum subsp. pretiosum]QUF03771.1 beta-ketoacyl-ACP synthase II [Actinosynnema pretiosum subsp. pretiosum]